MDRISALKQRWEDYQLTKTQGAWIGGGCIVATLVVGFGFAGWVTGGKAEKM